MGFESNPTRALLRAKGVPMAEDRRPRSGLDRAVCDCSRDKRR
jgi:hypothetical protein